MKTTITNLREFMEARQCSEKSFDDIKRNTYKYTNCGAWIEEVTKNMVDYESPHIEEFSDAPTYKQATGITVGSIVEGSDVDCTPFTLEYPFEISVFWEKLKDLEQEADGIWREWNE